MENLFPERFSELLKDCPYSYEELAKKLNLKSKGTISKYAKGDIKNVNMSMIIKIADLFQVSPIWLIGLTKDPHYIIADNDDIVRIPYVTQLKYGKKVIEKEIDPRNYLLASRKSLKNNVYFAYSMNDDSMSPFLLKGDILIIEEQEKLSNGQTIIGIMPDDTIIIRTVVLSDTGMILKPMNTNFDPIMISNKESDIRLFGVIKKAERNKYFN